MPRSFVIGDIHGNYKPLKELFSKAGFDYENDLLISLGDLVDRGPEPVRVVDELMKLRNFIYILGNHDYWCLDYLMSGTISDDWVFQGGHTSVADYEKYPEARKPHLDFFASARLYHIDAKNRLFVHAGFDYKRPFASQKKDTLTLLWDRTLYKAAAEYQEQGKLFDEFREIYIGHSPTQLVRQDLPTQLANLWMMDTGAGHKGLLSLMDIDTKETWQSSCVF